MLNRISNSLVRFATLPVIAILLIVNLVFTQVIFPWVARSRNGLSGSEIGPIDVTFAPSPETIFSKVAAYGEAGRAFYRTSELTVDVAYPLAYGFFFALLVTYTFRRVFSPDSPWQRLNLVPLTAMLFDLLENSGIAVLLTVHPHKIYWLAIFTSAANSGKWLLAGSSILLSIFGLLALVIKRLKGKR